MTENTIKEEDDVSNHDVKNVDMWKMETLKFVLKSLLLPKNLKGAKEYTIGNYDNSNYGAKEFFIAKNSKTDAKESIIGNYDNFGDEA